MNFSIFVYGTWGDLRPHVVLGVALKEAGHDVQVIASTAYEDWIRTRGLDFYPLQKDINMIMVEQAGTETKGLLHQINVVRNVMPPILIQTGVDVLEATRDSDVVITVEFGLALIFDVMKANNLKALLINPAPLNKTKHFSSVLPPAPTWFPNKVAYNHFAYWMIERKQWSLMGGARNTLRKEHLPDMPKSSFKEFRALLAETPALTNVSQHVLSRPDDWSEQFQVTGYLLDEDPEWTPPQSLVDFLDAGDAPVYIGFGSMSDDNPQATTQLLIDAIQKAGVRAIILTGWAKLGADDVPDNILILNYAPHTWLFPRMSAVIHHGGAGTTATGFVSGVPSMIVPHTADQPYWGRMVEQLGVGVKAIPRKKLTVDNLAQSIRELTSNPRLKKNAQVLSEKIAQEDGLAEAMKWTKHFLGLE